MKISVVTWDAGFREKLLTIDCFQAQGLLPDEVMWVDYYAASGQVKKRLSKSPGFRSLDLGHDRDSAWHLGSCINRGVDAATGDILVIPDGDIFMDTEFLQCVADCIDRGPEELVVYFRRFDEPDTGSDVHQTPTIEKLRKSTILTNPTNYGGCVAMRRGTFEKIGGYEEHPVFSGPGMNGMETYTRLRNAGCAIQWASHPIYHPWHVMTGSSSTDDAKRRELEQLKLDFPWLVSYSGILQSWIVHRRALAVSHQASRAECDQIIDELPEALQRYL